MAMFNGAVGAVRAVLISQVLLGVGIVVMDLRGTAGTPAPGLFAPPAQGPSVRPYRPDLRPGSPGTPAMRPMPDMLSFVSDEGAIWPVMRIAPSSDTKDSMSGIGRIAGVPGLPDMLSFVSDEGAIRMTGQIAPGDADRFAVWLDQNRPEATLVTLDSSGGSVSDALAIGRTIRAAGYTTEVSSGSVCMSACPYILAGGTERSVNDGGIVGVHQHYFGENTFLPAFMAVEDVQLGQAGVMDYLTEMGVDLRLMSHALRTPPEEINILDEVLMQELNLVTATS